MLDPQTMARIREILQGHVCSCGKPAERFRAYGKDMKYYCHKCFTELTEESEFVLPIHKFSREVHTLYNDDEGAIDLGWAPPLRINRSKRKLARR